MRRRRSGSVLISRYRGMLLDQFQLFLIAFLVQQPTIVSSRLLLLHEYCLNLELLSESVCLIGTSFCFFVFWWLGFNI